MSTYSPLTAPELLKGATLGQAIRLTPATLAYHITDGRWMPARHLLYISQEIAREIRQGGARLIIQAPPRHGKSELISVHTPIWFLDQWPNRFVMLTSFNADLPAGFSRRVRDTIASFGGVVRGPSTLSKDDTDDLPRFQRPLLNVRLRSDARQVSQWFTSENGGMFATGIGGSQTGRGTHLLLIDDFVKNAEEAASLATQEHIWEWFISTAYTRLEPGGNLIILATRWDRMDLIGRLMDKIDQTPELKDERWRVIELPAEAYPNDPLGRAPGEPLWPERYPLKDILERKAILGNYYYQALYQQRPIRREDANASIDDLLMADILPGLHHTLAIRSWDLAGSAGKGDYTVGTLQGAQGTPGSVSARYFLYDQVRGQWAPKAVEDKLRDTAKGDGPGVTIVIEQDPGSAGKAYAEYLQTKTLAGYKVIIRPANENKWVKAQPFMAAVENHQVTIRRGPWNKPFLDEFKSFPGTHDDTIDSVAIGFNYLMTLKGGGVVWGRTPNNSAPTNTPEESVLIRGATFGR